METQACCRFKKGDKVQFTSKFGDLVVGVFERYDAMPGVIDGRVVDVQGYIVIGKPFGPDSSDVNCFVPAGHLEKAV